MTGQPRVLAFHLPQFHPIPENDEWWGKGFTEWTNTARARPRFPGHYQPHVPADLGFYDLRLPEARAAQAGLARAYGVHGFIYWHYWFGDGRMLLQRPVEEIVASGEPDFPFAIGWANQSWSGIWHGNPGHVLMEQRYPGEADDRAHFDYLLGAFQDPRYITVNGKPLFYVFCPHLLPNAADFVERWQKMATDAGLPGLYLVAEVSNLLGHGYVYRSSAADGFDASVYLRMPADPSAFGHSLMRVARKMNVGEVFRYHDQPMPLPDDPRLGHTYGVIYPGWDNSPRSGSGAVILHGSMPEKFRPHVTEAIRRVRNLPDDEQLVFIKSWNEWAEGNHLEPDLRFGRGYLEVVRDELAREPSVADARGNTLSDSRSVRAKVRDLIPPPTRKRIQMWRYRGDERECPCCGKTFSKFWPWEAPPNPPRRDALCPNCLSLERHRLLWLYLHAHPDLVCAGDRVLHVAPEPQVADLITGLAPVEYTSADIEPGRAMLTMDVTIIDLPDDRFDIIVCSHVLEHVPDDRAAMLELRRVLAPGGWALLQTPLETHRATTYEDWSITEPDDRLRAFGQRDHVRVYGRDYRERLEDCGWDVQPVDFAASLTDVQVTRFGIDPTEELYFCR